MSEVRWPRYRWVAAVAALVALSICAYMWPDGGELPASVWIHADDKWLDSRKSPHPYDAPRGREFNGWWLQGVLNRGGGQFVRPSAFQHAGKWLRRVFPESTASVSQSGRVELDEDGTLWIEYVRRE